MAFRFRKSVKIAPGVRLNLSKSGVSTTVGGRGASVNVGKRGTYVNAGIPGSGISMRERLDRPARREAVVEDTPQVAKTATTGSRGSAVVAWIGRMLLACLMLLVAPMVVVLSVTSGDVGWARVFGIASLVGSLGFVLLVVRPLETGLFASRVPNAVYALALLVAAATAFGMMAEPEQGSDSTEVR